ncbi:hypothetical protein [Kitasatospora sp. LaBMicrA B282]|uniref:hypothetical protein n=1 Tax=Kitasatospora sp. LaBMicrA B282 TaxID=3420949 RepID=UPI003D1029A1
MRDLPIPDSRPRRRRSRRALPVAALAAAAVLLAAPLAQAQGTQAAAAQGGGGWRPFRSQPEDDPAGTVCSFHLHLGIVSDGEEVKTAATYPDGSPKKLLFRGPLVVSYTNLDTGRTVVRDQSGRGALSYLPDGSHLWVIPPASHLSVTVHPGDPYLAPGEYLYSGGVRMLVHPGDQPQVLTQHQGEDLCRTLS